MLVSESGPWNILDKLRLILYKLGVVGLFQCVWCMSIWMALVLPFMPMVVVVVLATSALAILFNKLIVGI